MCQGSANNKQVHLSPVWLAGLYKNVTSRVPIGHITIPQFYFGRKLELPYLISILIANSAGELSAGLVCICLPTIPILLCRRPQRSLSSNTSDCDPHTRHLRFFTPKQPKNIISESRVVRKYSKFGELCLESGDLAAPPAAVITAIEGGNPGGIRGVGPVDVEAKGDEFIQRPAIMKTVVVEQFSGMGR